MAKTGAIRAGRAYVEIFADNSKLIRGLRDAESRIRALGQSVSQLGRQMLKASAIAAAPFIVGGKVFGDFQSQMAMVSTMLEKPEKFMKKFATEIREMSVVFGQSTEILAKGLYDILSASVAPEKAMELLSISVKAAIGGMTDTATASKAIVNMLNSYGLSADRAADISDWLFAVVKRGQMVFEEIAPKIGQVSALAAVAGLSLEEFGASLTTMTRGGIPVDITLTALRSILLQFLAPTEEATAAAADLGIELNTTALKSKGLVDVLKKLKDASPETIVKIFPNLRGIVGVMASLQQLDLQIYDLELLKNRTGMAEEAFKKMVNTIKHSYGQVKQVGVLISSVIGEAIAKKIKMVSEVIVAAGKLTADWIGQHKELVEKIAKTVLIVGTLGAVLLTLGTSLKLVAFAMTGLAPMLKIFSLLKISLIAFKAIMAIAFSPLGIVIGLIALLIQASIGFGGVMDWLGEKFSGFKNDMSKAIGGISAALASGNIGLAAKILWLTLKMEWQKGTLAILTIWENIYAKISSFWTNGSFGDSIQYALNVAWAHIKKWGQQVWELMKGIVTLGMQGMVKKAATNLAIKQKTDQILVAKTGKTSDELYRGATGETMEGVAKMVSQAKAEAKKAIMEQATKENMENMFPGGNTAFQDILNRAAGVKEDSVPVPKTVQDARTAAEKAAADKIAASEEELAKTVEEFNKAVSAAKSGDAAPGIPQMPQVNLAGLSGMSDIGGGNSKSFGTFSAFALDQLGSQSPVLAALEKIARGIEKVVNNTEDNGED